ncbi:EscU/YscU/HrcU family type III secretion system export apparatus switch protein, partial [Yersinia pestis]
SHVVQYGFLISGEAIKPDIKKINPIEGAKRIFSIKSLVEFLKSILKVVLLSILIWIIIKGNLVTLLQLPTCGIECI